MAFEAPHRRWKLFTVQMLAVAWIVLTALAPNSIAAVASVKHSPAQPRSGQAVTVSAFVPGIENATLQIQVVSPGAYIRRSDRSFHSTWRDLPMEKHGSNFVASVPGEFQKHRTLVRYRIKGPSQDKTIFEPAATNAVPNFAWFTYDRLPEWNGASRPGRSPVLNFSSEFLSTLPTYHLIADAADVKDSQWNPNANRRPFAGTLVYDGRVYDHIDFHNRGQASTYVAGKNKWGFKFNPGHAFSARNNLGQLYNYKWTGFNLNPCASAWAPVNRGMAGLDEAISYRAYQLAGVPSPDTFWIHFRVIDSAEESSNNQFNTDLWGLYLVVQEKNGTWLRENKLPDGNIYSIDSGPKHLVNAAGPVGQDFEFFRRASSSSKSEAWWRAHLDLQDYYSFHALNRLLANIDLRPEGNYYLYHRPDDRWVVLPHDLDMMLIPKSHQPGYATQARSLDLPALQAEYQARAREILDLFASDSSPNGGQVGQLVAELSRRLTPAGQPRNWAELDEAMWNFHPRSQHRGQFYITPYEDHRMGGGWTRTLSSPNFAGFCKYIAEFCTDSRPRKNYRPNDGDQLGYGFGYLAREAKDDKIPGRPAIRSSFDGELPVGKLTFSSGAFSSPANARHAATQWRIAQIAAPGLKGYVSGQGCRYEIETLWKSGELPPENLEIKVPANVCVAGLTYRIRARHKDDAERWSHWSRPVQFVAKAE